jgi:hypothetical protein
MDREELELFTASLRGAVEQHAGPELDTAIDDLGWREALADDRRAIAAMFTAQGSLGVASSAIDDVLSHALGLEAGSALAVVMPGLGRYDAAVAGGAVVGFATHRALTATELVVVGDSPAVVPKSTLELRQVAGMDPSSGWVAVTGVLTTGTPTPAPWSAALPFGQLAIATELTALSRAMLELGRDHAVQRAQFGRAIGSFQAVRHKLADAYIAVESADAAVAAGWDEISPYRASMAKAIAGRTARTVAKHSQQVLAGMGFTAEHKFHLLMKRSLVLDQLLGSGAALSAETGRRAITEREVPPMLAL